MNLTCGFLMYIQATDRRYYEDPTILGHRWILFTEDDKVLVARIGRVSWSTTRRHLPKAGISCSLINPMKDRVMLIDPHYMTLASVFEVKLRKPIPPPDLHCGGTSWRDSLDSKVLEWT